MGPFNLNFDFGQGPVKGTAELLEQRADNLNFMRYKITAGERQSIICVKVEEEPIQLVNAQDAEDQYEAIHYSDHASGFSEEDVFAPEEISTIAAVIKAYNDTRKLRFDEMHFDF